MVYFIDATSGQSTRHQVVFLTLCLFFQALHLPITVMLALLLWRKPITQEPMRSINELVHRNIWRVDDSCWRCQPLEHSNPDKAREWPRASIGQQNIGATISSWSDKKKTVRIYLQHKSSSVVPQKTYWASTKPWGSLCQRPAHFDLKNALIFTFFAGYATYSTSETTCTTSAPIVRKTLHLFPYYFITSH